MLHFARSLAAAVSLVAFAAAAVSPVSSIAAPTAASPAGTGTIAAPAWQADVDALDRTLRALHPGLLRYQTEAEYAARVGALRDAFPNGTNRGAAFLALAGFTAAIRCGHTYPNPLNQPAATASALFRSRDRLPLWFRWIDRRMIVTRVLDRRVPLRRGDEVLALDGVPASAVLARLLPYARADGANDAKRIDALGLRGDARDEAFDLYYALAFGVRDGRMRLTGRDAQPGAPARTFPITAMTGEERAAVTPARAGAQNAPLFAFRLERGVGRLTMPTWAVFNTTWPWRRFVDDAFVRLRAERAHTLVVDLRGNEGGADVGDAIVAHLVTRPLQVAGYRRLVRYRRVPDDLRPLLATWDRSFYDWGAGAVPYDDRYLALTRNDDAPGGDSAIAPQAPRFAGRVFVLVDAANSSATFQFAQLVQRNHLATLAGTPTGGNRRGINGGAFFFLTLPNAQIEIDVPLIGTFPLRDEPDAGIVPDLLVRTTAQDVALGRDPVQATVTAP